jgi:dTDP-4-amino-4,6-dideoxy-D-galactose acyltransferase
LRLDSDRGPVIMGDADTTTAAAGAATGNAMSGRELCELLDWDSDHFGIRIGRVTAARLTRADARSLPDWMREREVACLYLLLDAGDAGSVRTAEDLGFRFIDVRSTLAAAPEVAVQHAGSAAPERVRSARADDVADLASIARVSHRDGRFHSDPGFPKDRADALYQRWIENSCGDYADAVFVAEQEDRPAGYFTCHLDDGGIGRIGLVAVAESARRRGLATQLGAAAAHWFAERGAERIDVVTQAKNLAALRFYQALGFTPTRVEVWLHLWRDELAHTKT